MNMVCLRPASWSAICVYLAHLIIASSCSCGEDELKPLLAKLTSKDPAVQLEGMFELIPIHDGVLACLPALTEIATTSTLENRAEALERIAGFGRHGKSAAPKLYPLLQHPEGRIRIAAAGAILNLETRNEAAVGALGTALRLEKAEVRISAAQELSHAGFAAKSAIPSLIAATKDADPEVRVQTVLALRRVTPARSDEVVAALHTLLKDEATGVAGSSAEALWHLDEPAEALVPTLINLVKEFKVDPKRNLTEDIWGSDAGVKVLGEIGPEASSAVPVLIAALDSRQTGERLAAADALGEIGPAAAPALDRLAKSLRETQAHSFPFAHHAWYVSDQAAVALRKIGPASRPILLAALADKDERVRAIAAHQLGQVPAERETAGALAKLLEDKDASVRAIAAFNLGRMKSVAGDAVLLLAARLNDYGVGDFSPAEGMGWRFSVGQHALEALVAIDPEAEAILPTMIESLKKDRRIEPAMLAMLRHLGKNAKAAVPVLEQLLADEKLRLSAAIALSRIEPEFPGLLEKLKKAVVENDDEHWTAIPAARGLGDLGGKAKDAISGLYAALERYADPSPQVLIAAAIVSIDPSEAKAVRAFADALRESPEQFFLTEGHDESAKIWLTLGANARPAEEFLTTGLTLELPDKDKDYFWQPRREKEVRLRSAELLIDVGIRKPAIVDALIRLCDSDGCDTRGYSLRGSSLRPASPGPSPSDIPA
jgi:HEAT repeat protein